MVRKFNGQSDFFFFFFGFNVNYLNKKIIIILRDYLKGHIRQ
jgi:hypothetical protein